MPRFFVLSGPEVGRTFDVEEGDELGRGAECAGRVRASSVSRRHARLEREGDDWYLADLGSRNGLSVDGRRVERARLEDGTQLKLGDVELRFRATVEAVPAAAPPPPEPASLPASEPAATEPAGPDELELEGEWEDVEAPEPAPRPASPAGARPAPAKDDARAAAARREELLRGGRKVLQYHRIPDRRGLLGTDLAQRPAWVRALVFLLGLGLFAAVFWGAMRLTLGVREKAVGGPGYAEEGGG